MWRLVLVSMLFSLTANASVSVTAKIHDIDYGQGNEDTFLLLTSGHVAWLRKPLQKSKANLFQLSLHAGEVMNFTLNDANELVSVKRLTQLTEVLEVPEPLDDIDDELYTPTVVESVDLAKKYFKESRVIYNSSQCYNRAHVWSYDWFKNHGVLSNKTWVFFTRRYIRRYENKWWFHVAPSLVVKDGTVIRDKVMDKEFANAPLNLTQWTNMFVKDRSPCRFVTKYSDYANYPETGSCFTMRSSMYYHQPIDLEIKENDDAVKTNWYTDDLKIAFLETLDEVIEGN